MQITKAQRDAVELLIIAISLSGKQFADIMTAVIYESAMTDDEIEMLSNRIGRIPSERKRNEYLLHRSD
ncbi:MAG: hypothetical protein Unbinned200contig1000_69 [Prokaryotic dsDNA virus sp.]|jgi:hypothetical protein|nr:hypothetical protein [Flavobacteriaceae bacterium]QDP65329.1 MAG: hypothetical protein Unbinned200contig1000_69 [Prokaryotic dsDNA virus sp.]|tara:strand:+ start:7741 stop:7947 length:207 start_codon:yes stop_codon:yes gene_type:complete